MTSLESIKYLKENKRRHWLEGDLSKGSLESIENDLKVLEILKEKQVDISLLMDSPNVGHYNRNYEHSRIIYLQRALTQEEFNQIKDWIEKRK